MSEPFRIGVISDTHGHLAATVFEIFKGVDLILHAGDIGGEDLLVELEAIAPVEAVSGNTDGPPLDSRRPLVRRLETPAGRIGLTHGHLEEAPAFYPERLIKFFDEFGADVVVHGHTHVPCCDRHGATTVFNPGAAGRSGTMHGASVGLITAEPGRPCRFEHIRLA